MGKSIESSGWLTTIEVIAQGVVNALIAVATILLLLISGSAALVAIGGTGSFTSSAPPAHPAWIALIVIVGLWTALQWCLIRLQLYLLKVIDLMLGAIER